MLHRSLKTLLQRHGNAGCQHLRSLLGNDHLSAKLAILLLALAILIGATVERFVAIGDHFAHVDDIGVAASILEARREINSVDSLRIIIHDKKLRQYDSAKLRLLRNADDAGLLAPLFGALSLARDVLAVPLRWTYAPGQYLLTPFLLPNDASYRTTLVLGRSPSVIFSILSMLLLPFVAWRLKPEGDLLRPVFALTVIALSLEHLVFSVHMSSYAIGVFAVILLMVFLSSRYEVLSERPVRFGIVLAATMWGLVHLTYQLLFLLPAALLALGIEAAYANGIFARGLTSWERLKQLLFMRMTSSLAIASILFALAIMPTYIILMSSIRPISWNVGLHGEFLFAPATGSSIGGLIVKAIRFTLMNLVQTFSAMTSPLPDGSRLYVPFTALLALLYVVGQINLLRDPSATVRFRIGLFAIFSLLSLIASALLGVTALSPTRHALIYLPIFAIGIAEGSAFLLSQISKREIIRLWTAAAMLALVCLIWLANAPSALAKRHDPFSEQAINRIIDETGAKTAIEYGFTNALDLMPSVRSRVALFNEQSLTFPWYEGRLPDTDTPILFVSQQEPLNNARLAVLRDKINKTLPPAAQWHLCDTEQKFRFVDERPSDQKVEVDRATQSGQNGYFVYVIDNSFLRGGC